MTNEEKAEQIAEQNGFFAFEEYEGAMKMAEWKDEQHAEEKQQWIEKACEWLKNNCTYTHPRTGKETCVVNLNAFKKSMEE